MIIISIPQFKKLTYLLGPSVMLAQGKLVEDKYFSSLQNIYDIWDKIIQLHL